MPRKSSRKRKKSKALIPILTSIYAKNFGPIYEASIPVRDFTIIMGPNNSGKTFLATLALFTQNILRFMELVELFEGGRRTLPKRLLNKSIQELLCELYTVEEPSELINTHADEAEIRFTFRLGKDVLEFKTLIAKNKTIIDMPEIRTEFHIPRWSIVYIPAERAGIMRTYRQLLRLHLETRWPHPLRKELLKKYEALGGKLISPPGLVKIFLDEILSIGTFTRSEISSAQKYALEMLQKAIGGKLLMREDLSIMYEEEIPKVQIPLERSSSSVSEVASIYLMTKFLSKNSLLVVEEPESHLHPRGQMMMARYFARLVRKNARVLITTHSDLLALKAAQLVGLSGISEEERIKLNYDKDEYLKSNELSICFLEPMEKGSVSKQIKVSPTGEVEDLPTYSTVVEEMYGEAVKLLELHRKISKLS